MWRVLAICTAMAEVKEDAKDAGAASGGDGEEFLPGAWQRMGTSTFSQRASEQVERMLDRVRTSIEGEDFLRVVWLSSTLFFVVGGYWLLRSLKDPIMAGISGVEYIPQAKIASLFVVLILVVVYNKLLDMMPKHHLFYVMGGSYGVMFTLMGFMLMHPTMGLPNTEPSPTRLLGWISYCTIESFGSMVVQAYWSLVNASVDVHFAKRNFGYIIAGAQIGSILGPSIATQADIIGVPTLYLGGAICMFCIVGVMYMYIERYGIPDEEDAKAEADKAREAKEAAEAEKSHGLKAVKKVGGTESKEKDKKKEKGGMWEGFVLLYKHDFVKGIFFISSLFMVNVTVIDYMMKLLAKTRYEEMYPGDPEAATRAFASFMGYFGQTTNSISFLFSLFGTGAVIKELGFTKTLIAFPMLLLVCTVVLWTMPTIWCVFVVMMVIKGMSYALNNPSKEILYQATSSSIKFKCKSWIDTFGQRSAKALGSLITNAFASSLVDLNNYGTLVGVVLASFLIWVSKEMGAKFEELQAEGVKVGEESDEQAAKELDLLASTQQKLAANEEDAEDADTSCLDRDDRQNGQVKGREVDV